MNSDGATDVIDAVIASVENAPGEDDPALFRSADGSLETGGAVLTIGDCTVGSAEGGRF